MHAQITAPDTVCTGSTVNFVAQAPANSYAWSVGSNTLTSQLPGGATEIPVTQIAVPANTDMEYDNGTYYAFSTNAQNGQIIRLNFGSNAYSTPTVTNLGNFSTFTSGHTQCIDIVKDSNNWYGFVAEDVNLVRLNFGNSLANTPTVTSMGFAGKMSYAMQISIRKTGNQWVGFCGNFGSNSIVRFAFGNSLQNTPSAILLPNYNLLSSPCYFTIYESDSNWYMLTTNLTSNQLVRYSFGSSIMNNSPTAVSLGNPGGALDYPRGIEIIRDCNSFYVLEVNETGNFVKLDFQNDITHTPSATVLGPLNTTGGDLQFLSSFWYNDTLNFLSSSFYTNKLFRIPAGSLPAASGGYYQQQYTHTFTTPGIYDITLMTGQGESFNSRSYCKQIVVTNSFTASISASGNVLTAGGASGTYQWALNGTAIPGATNSTFTATQSGTYSVTVTVSGGCTATASYTYFKAGIATGGTQIQAFAVYPNPANTGRLYVKAGGLSGREAVLTMYNATGQSIVRKHIPLTGTALHEELNTAAFAPGIYSITLLSDSGQQATANVIIQ